MSVAGTTRGSGEHWFERQPLWFKTAVFYEIHMLAVLRRQRRRLRRLPRAEREARLPPVARDRLHLAAADVPVAAAGRRLRHRRLLRRSTPTTGPSRTSRVFVEDGAPARHARDRRPRHEPHVGRPPVVPGVALRAGQRPSATGTCGRTPTTATTDARIIFIDTEPSNWTWDPVRRAVLLAPLLPPPARPQLRQPRRAGRDARRPALLARPRPRRLPARRRAVPVTRREGTNCENLPETHAFLKRVRAEVDARYPDRVLLAEANQWPEDVVDYFGDGDECHMAFHFPVMPRMFMALRREDAKPISRSSSRRRRSPTNCQWGLFLRNHDELTLEMVTDEERDYMYAEYAKDPRMKLNLGHPPAARAAARRRPRRDRADARDPLLAARVARSSTTATRSAWATTSTSATATASARRCSGRATATAASRAPTSRSSTCRR